MPNKFGVINFYLLTREKVWISHHRDFIFILKLMFFVQHKSCVGGAPFLNLLNLLSWWNFLATLLFTFYLVLIALNKILTLFEFFVCILYYIFLFYCTIQQIISITNTGVVNWMFNNTNVLFQYICIVPIHLWHEK